MLVKQEKPTKSKQTRLRKRNNYKKEKKVTKIQMVFQVLSWIFRWYMSALPVKNDGEYETLGFYKRSEKAASDKNGV